MALEEEEEMELEEESGSEQVLYTPLPKPERLGGLLALEPEEEHILHNVHIHQEELQGHK